MPVYESADFIEVALGEVEVVLDAVELGAGEEAPGDVVRGPCSAQSIDCCSKVLLGYGWVWWRRGHVGAAKAQVVERDVEEPPLRRHPPERLLSPLQDLVRLSLGEEKVAVPVALEGVEERVVWLPLGLHAFGFGEERAGVRGLAELVQRVCLGGPIQHPKERVAALVSVVDRIPSVGLGLRELSKHEVELA